MEKKQQQSDLHIFASNQSRALPVVDLEISIDGRQILHRKITTGTQHKWEQVTVPVASGEYTVAIMEVKSETRKSEVVKVDRELWIVVTFHSPPAELEMNVFDHPVAFM